MKRVFLFEIYVKQAASKPGISVLTPVWDLCKLLFMFGNPHLFEIYAKSSTSKTERNNINEPLLFEPYVKISYL